MKAPIPAVDAFIARWNGTAESAEQANYQMFLAELCAVLGVPVPDPAAGGHGDYRFERKVTLHHRDGSTSMGRIDLYKRGCFVLEAKQGANAAPQPALPGFSEVQRRANIRQSGGWTQGMLRAKGQAEAYSRDLPAAEESPPFLVVCDVGFCFDLYADFTRTGRHYSQFPDREHFRVYLIDLADHNVRDLLRLVWENPDGLDPARRRTAVTRGIAKYLAILARGLEKRHAPERVAGFLMRCVFSMFAQSVGLLPAEDTFSALLARCVANPASLQPTLGEFWRTMDTGGFSVAANGTVRRFNGGLFTAGAYGAVEGLPLEPDELSLLIQASGKDWADVEPAIFGTLLENALEKKLRDSLGAHFTPRAFVERLVLPTVMEPLRAEWDGAKAAALKLSDDGNRAGASKAVRDFHARLCAIRVLDPACGTGNFLYVTLELMKRLEGEVLDLLADLEPGEGDRFDLVQASVDPHQFLGIEKNVRAVPVAELVLWIGWLQWHFRTRKGRQIVEPILRNFHNIVGQMRFSTTRAKSRSAMNRAFQSLAGEAEKNSTQSPAKTCLTRPTRCRCSLPLGRRRLAGRPLTSSLATRRLWRARISGKSWVAAMPWPCGPTTRRSLAQPIWPCSSGGKQRRRFFRVERNRRPRAASVSLRPTASLRCNAVASSPTRWKAKLRSGYTSRFRIIRGLTAPGRPPCASRSPPSTVGRARAYWRRWSVRPPEERVCRTSSCRSRLGASTPT